ncbi:MAG: glycosyltransferase [Phycisphaerales bacterium]|nr:glycosyltransferase [Phycisphaerales bacterium]
MQDLPNISIVLATHNRREVVLSTLHRLAALRTDHRVEVIVIDNASTDGTADEIESCLPELQLIRLQENCGSCAKAYGAEQANGTYILFLDDDSHPHEGSLERMVEHFVENPRLGAAGFTVHLPDGRRESSALPHVFVGCGVGLRRIAYERVGGLDREFFMQAEEYDLCFRLMGAGWDVELFEDLHVDHLKTPRSRLTERTCFYDTRNNLLVTARYIPDAFESIYRDDVLQRYRWIAESQGHMSANQHAEAEAMSRYNAERDWFATLRLSPGVFEELFCIKEVAERMRELRTDNVRRIVLANLGKNIYPFVQAAKYCGIEVKAIADDYFALGGRMYRGIPIVHSDDVSSDDIDAIVVSNMSPAHAARSQKRWSNLTDLPVVAWYADSVESDPVSAVVPVEQAANSAEDAPFARAFSTDPWGVGDDAVGQPTKR